MAKDTRKPGEPHHLLQDKPEGSREMIERELKRQQSGETNDDRKDGEREGDRRQQGG